MNKTIIWKMGWHFWLALFVSLVLLAYAFWGGISELVFRWDKQEEYSHGYMLPVITLYFIWLKKNEIIQSEFSPTWLSFFIVVPALIIYLIGEVTALYILIHYSIIAVLLGMAVSIMGWPSVKPTLVPILLLIFAIPLPYFFEAILSANLQLWSSKLGVAFIRWCSIPVFLEGNVIDLGIYKLQVVEACSGLRYLFPLMSLGFICAYMYDTAFWKRAIVFLSTIPITLMMNSFRIGVIGVLVDNWGISMAEGFLHDFEGWIVFMACMGILFIEMLLLLKMGKTDARPLSQVFGLTYQEEVVSGESRTRPISYPFIGIIGLLVITIIVVSSVDTREEVAPTRSTFPEFPNQLGDWKGKQDSIGTDIIEALGLTDYIMTDFSKPKTMPVNFYVAYYESQRKGVSPHSPRVCIPGGGWQISDISRVQLEKLPVNRIIIKKGENTQLVYYWFQQRGRYIANEYFMKWYLFKDAVLMNRTDGALVRVTTLVSPTENIQDAENRLAEFVNLALPVLPDYIPE